MPFTFSLFQDLSKSLCCIYLKVNYALQLFLFQILPNNLCCSYLKVTISPSPFHYFISESSQEVVLYLIKGQYDLHNLTILESLFR